MTKLKEQANNDFLFIIMSIMFCAILVLVFITLRVDNENKQLKDKVKQLSSQAEAIKKAEYFNDLPDMVKLQIAKIAAEK